MYNNNNTTRQPHQVPGLKAGNSQYSVWQNNEIKSGAIQRNYKILGIFDTQIGLTGNQTWDIPIC